ncbi:MAG: stage II sporulation protein M [Dehalococcoidales bacterium]
MSYKIWLYIASFLFGAGLVGGLFLPVDGPGLLTEDLAALEDMAGLIFSLPQIAVFFLILVKNISVVVISLIFSPFFLLVPALSLVVNGGVVGLVSVLVIREYSLMYLLSGLLPHGIFEIPALIMAEAVAFSFGSLVFVALFNRERRQQLIPNLRQYSSKLKIVLLLLVIAAAIETWITPLLLG